MRNIRLTIEYDGSRYQGWIRPGSDLLGNTVSAKLTDVLKRITKEPQIELHYACRTEAGVHAYAQVANFKTASEMDAEELKHALNRYLPMDIAIIDVKEMPERFHAQLNAVSKTYLYRMDITDVPSVFERRHAYPCFRAPDKAAMQQAAAYLAGKHDFVSFSDGKKSKSTVKEIYSIDIYGNEEEMQIQIRADDFLHNMARLMIGTLLDVGLGLRPKEDVADILNGTKPPSPACDPKGLYLQEITY